MTGRQLAAPRATRTKLLRAGKTIICQKGLEHTSVEEITEAAGVSKGTFYTYFRRKEDIVFELSRGMFGEILAEAKSFSRNLSGKNWHIILSEFFRVYPAGQRPSGSGVGKGRGFSGRLPGKKRIGANWQRI